MLFFIKVRGEKSILYLLRLFFVRLSQKKLARAVFFFARIEDDKLSRFGKTCFVGLDFFEKPTKITKSMKKYIALAALLAAGTACMHAEQEYEPVTENTTFEKGGDLYAGEFVFTFELEEDAAVTGDYDIIAAYYQVNGNDYNVNAFVLKSDGTLELARGGALSSTTLTNDVTTGISDKSVFKTSEGVAYVLTTPGTYTIDYLGDGNGSAAANLLFGGEIVASFTGGNHNMNGAQNGGDTLNLALNSSYSATYMKPIPEPSAFGMLAGLGALALVASRRRRK